MNNTYQEDQDALDQRVFDSSFVQLNRSGKRHACPCCCPGANFKMSWARGVCLDDNAERTANAFQCPNCGHVEYYTAPKPKRDGSLTNSQQRFVERCKNFFTEEREGGAVKITTEVTDYGDVWVYVSSESCYGTDASFTVTRRGKATCYTARAFTSNTKAHVAKMLGAGVSKY